MNKNETFATLTDNDWKVWGAVVMAATLAGLFRVLRNGQWKGKGHAVGVVGCSTVVSGFMASICHALFDFCCANPVLLVWLSAAVALLGKEIHERLILGGIDRVLGTRTTGMQDDQIAK